MMDFLINNAFLVTVAVVTGAILLWPMLRVNKLQELDTSAVVAWMNGQWPKHPQGNKKAWLVDVRTAQEFAQSYPARAKNIPLQDLAAQLPKTAKDKAQPLIFTCARGGRAKKAATLAQQAGYTHVFVLAGGLEAWKQSNLPLHSL
jgi:rhodanese-related sulfurtransferase